MKEEGELEMLRREWTESAPPVLEEEQEMKEQWDDVMMREDEV